MSKLILLKRLFPLQFEIHMGEINKTKNLLFTTTDEKLANDIVTRYNVFVLPENNVPESLVKKTNKNE